MSRAFTMLRVLVASPDDVAEERSLVEQAIDEYNRINRDSALRLERVGWERDIVPGFATDPQAVINDQVADDYDIFIGILWTRFGTPTPRALSGTKEEFDRAHKRFLASPDDLRIMLYFSECPVNPADLDLSQIQLIKDFRQEVSGKGGLYSTYRTVDEFHNLVRIHLSRQAQGWGNTWGDKTATPTPNGTKHASPSATPALQALASEDDDEGLIDLVVQGQESIEEATEITKRIGQSIQRLGRDLTTRTAELNSISGSSDLRLVRRFLNRSADDLLTFAEAVDADTPLFAGAYAKALDAFGRSSTLLREINPSDTKPLADSRDAIRMIIPSIESGIEAISTLRATADSIPPISTSIRRAKSRAVASLDNLAAEWLRTVDASKAVLELFDATLLAANATKADTKKPGMKRRPRRQHRANKST